jgi:hypothetical protein
MPEALPVMSAILPRKTPRAETSRLAPEVTFKFRSALIS